MVSKAKRSAIRLRFENVVSFPVDLHLTQMREIQLKIRQIVGYYQHKHVFLVFQKSRTGFAEFMLPFCSFALSLRASGVKFFLTLPEFDRLRRLFINCGWANIIAPHQFREAGSYVGGNIPATQFDSYPQQHALVNQCVDKVLKRASKLDRGDLQALEWSVNEICDNVLNHAHSPIGGLFQMNIRQNSREVEFIVADAGVGIPDSLRSISHKDWTDRMALEQSIKQGVTRDPEFGQGNGLYGTYRMAVLSGGTFHINAGYAHLVATRDGEVQVREDPILFNGSLVVCAIKFSRVGLLEKALAFKGADYKMVDFVELAYEAQDGKMLFDMASEAESFGSRTAGFAVRRKLNNLLAMNSGQYIFCDMSKVSLMSSSFADEVFGKLAREFGLETFQTRIRLSDVSETNTLLIRKAVTQRLASPY